MECTDRRLGGHFVQRLPVLGKDMFVFEVTKEFVDVSVVLCGLAGFLEA